MPAGPVVPDPPGSARIRPFHGSAPATLNPLRLLHLGAVYFMDLSPHRFLRAVPHVMAAFPGFLLLFLGGASGMGRGAAQLLWRECAPSDYPGPGRAGGRPGSLYGGGWRSSLQGAWPVPSLWAAVSGKPAHLSFHPGLPKSEYKRPRLLVGPQGRAPREQGPGLSVGRWSLAQLQVRKGRWGRGRSAPGASAWTHLRDSLGTAKLATRTWLRHKFGALYVISQVYA